MTLLFVRSRSFVCLLLLALCLAPGCDLADVENPNVTTETFLDSPQSASIWLNGTRAQMASTLGVIVELTEITTDNYFNNRTLSSKVFDLPQIVYTDLDVGRLQTEVQSLRRTATFGLNTVLPADQSSTPGQEAELRFYLGVAHLFSGEYFTGLPAEELGPILSPDEHFSQAVEAFQRTQALSSDSELARAARLAQARIAYYRNDTGTLRREAETVLDEAPTLNYQVEFDGVNGPENAFQFFVYDSSQDEFAPLPRLDFLDPKYFSEDGAGQDQKSISLFKAEEAHLMLAEANLAEGNVSAAKEELAMLVQDLLPSRPTWTIDDSRETRSGGNRANYPLSDAYRVKPSPAAAPVDGLVLDRQSGPIEVPAVSRTSVTLERIDEVSTTDELLELIYLMRQEIFFAEGRRVVDLGIRYPVSESEVRVNPNITDDDSATDAQIPGFIPRDGRMDNFSTDEANEIVTVAVNMNKVLVENRSSEFVLPLW